MLTIRAVSFKGQPIGREVTARFGEAGGTIGRGETNTLVLADPERFISRTHATISFQAGGYIITDNGTKNPVTLNGRPLGSGSQARLGDRDQIKIGDYLLEVALAPLSAPAPPPARAEAASKIPDPFADLLRPVERPGPRTQPIFPLEPAAPKRPEAIPADAFADLRAREPSIDDLIGGIKPAHGSDLLAGPELPPGAPMDRAAAGVVDPLDILAGTLRPIPPPSVSDHGPELFTPYAPPAAKPEAPVKPAPEIPRPVPQPGAPPALAPQVHGFIPPLRAMKDAYDDLRAHQLGFLAGMRAALEEVLARFGPRELDKRLSAQSMLDDLLPMNRKAKLWDLFIERHAALTAEAREDFNAAFGKAFRRAYEAQVKQLRDQRV